MRSSFLLLAIVAGLSLQTGRAAADQKACPPFEFEAKFMPSFHADGRLLLRFTGEAATLAVDASGDVITVPVERSVAEEFFRTAKRVKVRRPVEYQVLDVTSVVLDLRVAGKETFSSSVHAPDEESAPTEIAFLRALYRLVEKTPMHESRADYMEEIFHQVGHVLPRWRFFAGTDPHELRLTWPAPFLVLRMLAWWALMLTILIDSWCAHFLTEAPWPQSIFVSVMNTASLLLSVGILPLAGLGWYFSGGAALRSVFSNRLHDLDTWLVAMLIAIFVSAVSEALVLRYGARQQRPLSAILKCLIPAKTLFLGIVCLSVIVSPPDF